MVAAGCFFKHKRKHRAYVPDKQRNDDKSEIFNTILRMVSEETEIPSAQILSGRKDTETVDARYLLVHFLFQSGLNPSYIAARIGKTERAVNQIHTNFDQRLSTQKIFRISCERIRKRLGNNSFPE